MHNGRRRLPSAAIILILGCAVLFAGLSVAAAEANLVFDDVWARAASQGHTSAIYMSVSNPGPETVSVVAARSAVAERVEMHETTTEISFEGGRISQIMRMEEIEALAVPAGETVELKPGGLHIMLIGLTRDIESGDHFVLELLLADGRQVTVDVAVRVGSEADDHHDHHDH